MVMTELNQRKRAWLICYVTCVANMLRNLVYLNANAQTDSVQFIFKVVFYY